MDSSKTVAGRFFIEDQESDLIGQGGMGAVYLGRDISTGQPVAVKHLRPDLVASDPELVQRFAREGEALRQLNHPNIVKVLATVEQDGQHYIVMEYVAGGSLRDLMDSDDQLSLDAVLAICLEVADALARAHHLNIIHRDIKPANVLLADDNTPRLTDFGIALMGDQSRITQAGALAGTYAYLCPEAWEGRALDARADIWSFGVLLYEMIAGKHPFQMDTLAATFAAILQKEPTPLMELRPDVSRHLAELVHGMLHKDPDGRIASVRLVGATLEAIHGGATALGASESGSRFSTPALASHRAPSNIPIQSTPFIGRSRELGEIANRIEDPSCRLLTLVGLGGIGKTRLAIQAGENHRTNFRHGVYLIGLAPLSSPDSIVPTIADAIGFSFYRTEDPDRIGPSARQQLMDHLREKEMLLILDNYEHLLERADLAADILAIAPGVKLLATSRERLNILGEWVMQVEGLAYPAVDSPDVPGTGVTAYSSVQLFLQRATQMGASIQLDPQAEEAITRICQLVDGTPLAIELAASWLQTLSPAEIVLEVDRSYAFLATTLRDMPQRHRSLRIVFENSWALLSEAGRLFLAKLSVFKGGFDREAVLRISPDSSQEETLALLAELLSKSLLRRSADGRYELHQLLHQFAAEKLQEIGDSMDSDLPKMTRDLHSEHYCDWLQSLEEEIQIRRKQQAIAEVERDIENVRVAWRWAARSLNPVNLGRALPALSAFLASQNWHQEGADLLGLAVERLQSVDSTDRLLLARAEAHRAGFTGALGELDAAGTALRRSLETFRELGSTRDEADALAGLGQVLAAQGFLIRAADHHKRSLVLYRQLDDQAGIAAEIDRLGRIANERGRYDEARTLLEQALTLRRRLGDLPGTAGVLDTLGFNAYRLGDADSALRLAEESLLIHESVGNRAGAANAIRLKGMVASLQGDYEQAKVYYEEALAIRRDIGNRGAVAGSYTQLSHLALMTGDYVAAKEHALQCKAIVEEIKNRWALIYALNNLGLAQVHLGESEEGYESLLNALRIARDMNAEPLALEILVGFAELAASEGEYQRALSILCLVRDHPALIKETWDMASRLFERLRESSPAGPSVDPCSLSDQPTLTEAIEDLLAR